MTDTNIQRIAEQNDRFRRGIIEPRMFDPGAVPGIYIRTRSIAALPGVEQLGIMAAVRDFSAFTAENDPHGERDFGALDIEGVGKVFWKIDYYSPDLMGGSEDPSDLSQTKRVLIIMLASEY